MINKKKNNEIQYKTLSPEDLLSSKKFVNILEKKLIRILLDDIFKPLKKILYESNVIKRISNKDIYNSLKYDDNERLILDLLKNNVLFYKNGYIKGNLTSNISKALYKMGAIWDRKEKAYKVIQVSEVFRNFIQERETKKDKLKNFLQTSLYFTTIISLNKNIDNFFKKDIVNNNLKNITEDLLKNLQSKIEYLKPIIDTETFINTFNEKMKINIKGFAKNEVEDIRKKVLNKINKGATHSQIIDLLKEDYAMSDKKAQSVARGETNIVMSSYQYSEAQLNNADSFSWYHPKPDDINSRQGHVGLYRRSQAGERFSFSNPPIDHTTNKPTLPATERGCRCKAVIIFKKN